MTPQIGSLFTGMGGLDLGVQSVFGGNLAWVCENDTAASKILAARYRVPNLGDITTTNWDQVQGDHGEVDILTGGVPCQSVSHAGKREGLGAGTRTGLWANMAEAIDALRPYFVVFENVRGILSARADSDLVTCSRCVDEPGRGHRHLRALGRVLGDLSDLRYDAAWHGIQAADVGAPHRRMRIFLLAWDTRTPPPGWLAHRPTTAHPDHVDDHRSGQAGQGRGDELADRSIPTHTGPGLSLLPTPAVNDMGEGKSLDWWDEWAPRQKASDGRIAPHGKSLAIESLRMLPTPTAADHKASGSTTGHAGTTLTDATVRQADRFGDYAPAIQRWEQVLGRPAPDATAPTGKGGAHRLNPAFVEWMQGLPAGWVTDPDLGLSRNAMLKILGNGVVSQQSAAALTWLYDVYVREVTRK